LRVAVQIQPADTPDYATWRQAFLHAEEIGVDVIVGYDDFHAPFIESIADAKPGAGPGARSAPRILRPACWRLLSSPNLLRACICG
jgi:hypothetical protein